MSCVSCGPSVQFIPTASAPAIASVARACGAASPNAVRPSARNVISATIGIVAESPRTARTASAASSRLPKVSSRMSVDAGVEQDPRLLLEDLPHLGQLERAVGLHERPERPDRARDEDELARRRLAREAHALAVDLLERVRPFVRRELDAVGVPRVRRDDLRARVDVVVMDLAHRIRVRQVQRRPRLFGIGAARSQQRPHRAVGEEDLLGECLAEVFLHVRRPGLKGC